LVVAGAPPSDDAARFIEGLRSTVKVKISQRRRFGMLPAFNKAPQGMFVHTLVITCVGFLGADHPAAV